MLRGQVEVKTLPPACRIEEGPRSIVTLPVTSARLKDTGKWGSGVDLGGLKLETQADFWVVQNNFDFRSCFKDEVLEISLYLCWAPFIWYRLRSLSHHIRICPFCRLVVSRWNGGKVIGGGGTCNCGGTEHTGREDRSEEWIWRLAALWGCGDKGGGTCEMETVFFFLKSWQECVLHQRRREWE